MPDNTTTKNTTKFYGRRKGKKLHATRQTAYDEVLPTIRIDLPEKNTSLNPSSLFNTDVKEIWMEIGFGDGGNLAHMAQNNPDIGMIGCEPFINGVATLCRDISAHNITNIRVYPDDARQLMSFLPTASLARIYLLNSDPWPKTRHHKRRFIQKDTLDEIHRLLQPEGLLRMSTDHPGLAAWEMEKTWAHPGFTWIANHADDWRKRPAEMVETRYQKKQMAGMAPVFMTFQRNG